MQTNLLYFKYTSHLRRKSTMRRCFYHTDLVQNAVVHNFSRQIAFIQYSGPSKHAWTFSETVQKISKITYTASWCHRCTGRGRGGLQPPQILGNSVFLGSKRKFGQSQVLKTFPCFFFYYYFEEINILYFNLTKILTST